MQDAAVYVPYPTNVEPKFRVVRSTVRQMLGPGTPEESLHAAKIDVDAIAEAVSASRDKGVGV